MNHLKNFFSSREVCLGWGLGQFIGTTYSLMSYPNTLLSAGLGFLLYFSAFGLISTSWKKESLADMYLT